MMVRLKRQIISWIGLVLLAFNVAGGATLPFPVIGSNTFDDTICTQSGIRPLRTDGPLQKSGDHPSSPQVCIFCLPLLHGGLNTVPDGPRPSAPTTIIILANLSRDDQRALPSIPSGRSNAPRAPPFS